MYQVLEGAPQGSAAWHAARTKHFCATEAAVELQMVHELAAARVALREIEDALNQSKMIANSAC